MLFLLKCECFLIFYWSLFALETELLPSSANKPVGQDLKMARALPPRKVLQLLWPPYPTHTHMAARMSWWLRAFVSEDCHCPPGAYNCGAAWAPVPNALHFPARGATTYISGSCAIVFLLGPQCCLHNNDCSESSWIHHHRPLANPQHPTPGTQQQLFICVFVRIVASFRCQLSVIMCA